MRNNRLIAARYRNNMRQSDLAKAVGVSRQTITCIESGKSNPSISLCKDICKILNVTLNDIFGDEKTIKSCISKKYTETF